MQNVSEELAKRVDIDKYKHQERFGEALNLLLDYDEDKEELIRLIDAGTLDDSDEILGWAVKRQLQRDEEEDELGEVERVCPKCPKTWKDA